MSPALFELPVSPPFFENVWSIVSPVRLSGSHPQTIDHNQRLIRTARTWFNGSQTSTDAATGQSGPNMNPRVLFL